MFRTNKDFVNWILPYLPIGAELLYRDKQAILQYLDIDGDGTPEIFGFYRFNRQLYLFVLKNYLGNLIYYYPIPPQVEKKAVRVLSGNQETRAVYLFPVVTKEIGGNKWGFIDSKGNLILPAIYEHAEDFQDNGLAIVGLMNKSGIINERGYFIVKPKYDTINQFSEGRAIVNDYQGFKVIDESGKEITEKAYSIIVGEYKEGRVQAVETDAHGKYLYGYLNRRGKVVIPIAFESASEFTNGKAIVKPKGGSFQLIDLTGTLLHSYPFDFVGNYGQGMLTYKKSKDGKLGYIDEHGRTVIEPQFSNAEPFVDGRAIVSISENSIDRYGLIDRNGHFVIKPNYNHIINLGEGRFAIGKAIDPKLLCTGSLYAIADSDGHILTGFIFNEITDYQDGLASVSDNQHTFFIDKSGKRSEYLPMVNGSGTLRFVNTLIKGEVDNRLQYFNRNGVLIWKYAAITPINKPYSVVEVKYKPNKDYLVYFPELVGLDNSVDVNSALKELAGVKPIPAHTQLESSYTGDFNLTFYKKNLLVIEITGYDYPFCAAHGMPVKNYAHINLKTGSLYQLKSLFKPGSSYVKVISDIIGDQIKSNGEFSYLFPDEYKGIQTNQPFYISETGVNIYFKPYEIAAFAAGFPTFFIPFEDLKDIIDVNSDFWKSFH